MEVLLLIYNRCVCIRFGCGASIRQLTLDAFFLVRHSGRLVSSAVVVGIAVKYDKPSKLSLFGFYFENKLDAFMFVCARLPICTLCCAVTV